MIDRRTFLIGTGLGANTNAATKPALRLAFSLYGMKTLPMDEAIQSCKEIGYEGVEVCLLDGWQVDRTVLKNVLGRHRMEAASFMEKLTAVVGPAEQTNQLNRLRNAADLSLSIDASNPPVIETVLGGKPADWEPSKERIADRIREWAGVMERRKVVLCVKAHVAAAVDTPDKLLWLHKQVSSPFLKLTYDYSHYQLMGLDPAVTMKQIVPFTRFVHVKDAVGTAENPKFLLVGDGRLDYKEHFRILRKLGYRGWIVVEVSSQLHSRSDYNPLRAARQCFERLKPVLD